jgi:predicted RNA-binding Zn-ribbon protein involved in translation (DUF1610 family)
MKRASTNKTLVYVSTEQRERGEETSLTCPNCGRNLYRLRFKDTGELDNIHACLSCIHPYNRFYTPET